MSDLLPSLDERRRRLKTLKLIAKRTAQTLARVEAFAEMHLQTNAVDLLNNSLKSTFAEISEIERLIMIEESRNTTRREGGEEQHA